MKLARHYEFSAGASQSLPKGKQADWARGCVTSPIAKRTIKEKFMFDGIDEQDMHQRFTKLQADLNANPTRQAAFHNDPLPFLTAAGIPLLQTFPTPAPGAKPAPAPAVAPKHHLLGGAGGAVGAPGAAVAAPGPGQISASVNWWGVNIVTDEAFTQGIIDGVTDVGGLTAALTPVLAGAIGASALITGPVAGGLALAFIAKIIEIKLVDLNHGGVYWPLTWPQILILITSAGAGPVGIAASAAVFVHPLPN